MALPPTRSQSRVGRRPTTQAGGLELFVATAGNDAWSVGANSDYCVWYRCKGLDAYRGFDLDTGALGCLLYLCEGSNNANIGIVAAGVQYAWACIADGNGSIGCYGGYAWVNSVASNNGDDGFANGDYYVNCTAYNNTAFGYDLPPTASSLTAWP